MKHNFRFDVKQMRYVGENNFTQGVRLDIDFDDIFESIHHFTRAVGINAQQKYHTGKPRFNSLCPEPHCEMPILSKDYYLIGFTDSLSGGAEYYKFLFTQECSYEYMKPDENIKKYESFEPKCKVLERL